MSFLSCFTPKNKQDNSEDYKSQDHGGDKSGSTSVVPKLEDLPKDKAVDVPSFDTAREAETHPGVVTAEITKPKPKTGYPSKKLDQGQRFVRELPKHPEYRRQLVELIKGSTDDEGLPEHLIAYINDNGFSLPSLGNLTDAMTDMKANNLLMWASRYNLFVQWSADRQHPWDSLEGADQIAATLEIGKARGSDEVIVQLDSVNIKNWSFSNGVFSTKESVEWTTPAGDKVQVELSLKFGAFFGYSKPGAREEDLADVGSQSYLGTQCHGVMWPATFDLPFSWPISPPIVAGKVNIASRDAAVAPGATDPISIFSGVYSTHYLPGASGENVRNGPELSISTNSSGRSVVGLNGSQVEAWAFSPNNVLSWEDGGGHTAWLLFMSLAGGPVIMGNVLKPEQGPPTGFSIFGELKNQPSRLSPEDQMDSVVGHKVAAGLQVASTLLLGEILTLTQRLWTANGTSNGAVNGHGGGMEEVMLHHKIDTLLQLEDLSDLFSRAFLESSSDGGVRISASIAPELADEAYGYYKDASDKMELANYSANASEKDARETEEADKAKNVAVATYKAAQASLRAQEAAEAAAEAERAAVLAAKAAARAATVSALDHSLAAAQAFNQARHEAFVAAKAERRAATAALSSVEAGIEYHAKAKNFDKLRETAQASGIATKVLSLASQAVEGWETNTVASRLAALQAARAAANDAQECNKQTRRMQPTQSYTDSASYE